MNEPNEYEAELAAEQMAEQVRFYAGFVDAETGRIRQDGYR